MDDQTFYSLKLVLNWDCVTLQEAKGSAENPNKKTLASSLKREQESRLDLSMKHDVTVVP